MVVNEVFKQRLSVMIIVIFASMVVFLAINFSEESNNLEVSSIAVDKETKVLRCINSSIAFEPDFLYDAVQQEHEGCYIMPEDGNTIALRVFNKGIVFTGVCEPAGNGLHMQQGDCFYFDFDSDVEFEFNSANVYLKLAGFWD